MTIQFKQHPDSKALPDRWSVGVDHRRVVAYVALAVLAGFASGFAVARYTARRPAAASPLIGETVPPIRQAAPDTQTGEFHRVTRIVRGDTVEVEALGPVRMIGIETPDGKSPREIYGVHGQRAVSYVEKTLLGQEVRLEYDAAVGRNNDDSGQILAYVYTRDGTLINREMVRQGLALVRGGEQFRLTSDFLDLERDAMQAMRGVWGSSSEATSASATAATQSPLIKDKPNRLQPLPPSALGANIPALTGSTNASSEQSVWVSASNKMYHKPGCELLDKRKHSLPLSQAKAEGYTACSRCYASTLLKAP
jgi:micrococcal nuclease